MTLEEKIKCFWSLLKKRIWKLSSARKLTCKQWYFPERNLQMTYEEKREGATSHFNRQESWRRACHSGLEENTPGSSVGSASGMMRMRLRPSVGSNYRDSKWLCPFVVCYSYVSITTIASYLHNTQAHCNAYKIRICPASYLGQVVIWKTLIIYLLHTLHEWGD